MSVYHKYDYFGQEKYDYIVVGGGISGLISAYKLKKQFSSCTVAIAEQYKTFGGRTYSYYNQPNIQWEMGAGRVHKSHKYTINLIKKYGLTLIPIDSKLSYKKNGESEIIPNPFEAMNIPLYLNPISLLDKDILESHTLEELSIKFYGLQKHKEIFAPFPYTSEVATLRADLALKEFMKGEMSSHEGYFTIKEGFSELTERIKRDCEAMGVVILAKHKLIQCKAFGYSSTDLKFITEKGVHWLRADKCCVLALHLKAVRELPILKNIKVLKHLDYQPLFRIYMKFSEPWFKGLGRVVSDDLPRYILPINEENGTCMISYTDGADTRVYARVFKKYGEYPLSSLVMKDVRKLFPDKKIPNPLFIAAYFWDLGATYWKPGHYDPERVSRELIHPLPSQLPGVYLTGESWSLKQAWVEGALEQTNKMLHQLF